MSRDIALQEAINAMPDRSGKLASLAEKLGITSQALSQWHRVPVSRVIEVERITGVPKEKLRPDIYPPQEAAA